MIPTANAVGIFASFEMTGNKVYYQSGIVDDPGCEGDISMAVLESGEDYIETIYRLKKKNGAVYSIDVARQLGFSRPSVSRAVGILRDEGLITMDEVSKEINLTEKGRKKAVEIYDRHKTLTSFLRKVAGVSEKIAEADACRMEHFLSASTYRGIKNYMKNNP